MKIKLLRILLAVVFVFGLFSLAQAGKPQDSNKVFLGNGFPSGPHFNLNIKADLNELKNKLTDNQTIQALAPCIATLPMGINCSAGSMLSSTPLLSISGSLYSSCFSGLPMAL